MMRRWQIAAVGGRSRSRTWRAGGSLAAGACFLTVSSFAPFGRFGASPIAAVTGGSSSRRHASSAVAGSTVPAAAAKPDGTVPESVIESLTLIVPTDAYMPVSEVYAALPSAERNIVRKSSFKQLGRLLATLQDTFDITPDRLLVRRLSLVEETRHDKPRVTNSKPQAPAAEPTSNNTASKLCAPPAAVESKSGPMTPAEAAGKKKKKTAASSNGNSGVVVKHIPLQPPPTPAASSTRPVNSSSSSQSMPPADPTATVAAFGYGSIRSFVPPPVAAAAPRPVGVTGAPGGGSATAADLENQIRMARDPSVASDNADGGGALSAQMLASYIPPYFVPVSDVLALMPDGYTEEHISTLFSGTGTLQMVSVLDAKFIRFLGASRRKRLVDMLTDEGAIQVRAAMSQFKPNPDHLAPFLPRLEPRGEWKSLFQVVTGVSDPEHAAKLPFHGPQSLLYFAQMQHIIAFSDANGGGLCVPMRPPTGLDWPSTPTVIACHDVWRALEGNPTQLCDLWNMLGDEAKEEITLYFGEDSVLARSAGLVGLRQDRGWAAFQGDANSVVPPPAAVVAPIAPEDATAAAHDDDGGWLPARAASTAPLAPTRGWITTTADEGGSANAESTPPTTEPNLVGESVGPVTADATTDGAPVAGDPDEAAAAASPNASAVDDREDTVKVEAAAAEIEDEADDEVALMRKRARELEDSEGVDETANTAAESTAIANATSSAQQTTLTAEDDEDDDEVGGNVAAGGESSETLDPLSGMQQDERDDTPVEAALRRFVNAHGEMFSLRPNSRLALLAFEVKAYERQNMSLEQQYNMAVELRNNSLARKIKRKMVIMSQPDNPLLDEANLAQAIADFLPPDRPLPWRALKNVLPSDILDLIPVKRGKKFFESYPQLFRVFEVYHAGRKVIQRGHLPPPNGCLRGEGAYSENEMLRIVGNALLMRSRSVSGLLSRLPSGVERTLAKQYGGVAQFCQKYPQYFAVVLKDAQRMDYRTAFVTLLELPPPPEGGEVPLTEDGSVEPAPSGEDPEEDLDASGRRSSAVPAAAAPAVASSRWASAAAATSAPSTSQRIRADDEDTL